MERCPRCGIDADRRFCRFGGLSDVSGTADVDIDGRLMTTVRWLTAAIGRDHDRRMRHVLLTPRELVDDRALIGRERERVALELALADVRAGRGGLTLVAGEAGVGKTRLVDDALRVDGIRSLRGDAPAEAPPAYAPVAAALRAFLRVEPHGFHDC